LRLSLELQYPWPKLGTGQVEFAAIQNEGKSESTFHMYEELKEAASLLLVFQIHE
jgi:hypothetical protein